MNNLSESFIIFAPFWILLLFGTVWGVTRVLFPLLKITWHTTRITILTMLVITPMFTGYWFRLFGYNAFDISWASMPAADKVELRRFREENHALSGSWEPKWREKQNLAPLPVDWDGESYHRYPGIASILVPLLMFGFYAGVNLLHNIGGPGTQLWRYIPRIPKSIDMSKWSTADVNNELLRIFEENAAIPEGWWPDQIKFKPAPGQEVRDAIDAKIATVTTNDKEFTSALRGLGYKIADIRAVLPNCTEKDLEARVRHALQLLKRK